MSCGDNLVISFLPEKIGLDKFEITYEITVDEVMVAKAITRHVCINVSSRIKQELPPDMNNWLEMNRSGAEGAQRRRSRSEFM
jgi:1,4-dihydroxy-2-naphthoyl-CoA hydrolase